VKVCPFGVYYSVAIAALRAGYDGADNPWTPARIPPGKVRGVSVKNLCTPVGNGIGHTVRMSLFLTAFPLSDALYHGGKKILGLQKIYCLVRVQFFMGWLV